MRNGHIASKGLVLNGVVSRGRFAALNILYETRRLPTWRDDSAIQLAKKTFQLQGSNNIDISWSVRKI